MLKYFRFPKDESTRLKWVQRCGRKDKVSSSGRLCGLHFSPQQYARDLQSELLGIPAPRNKRLLKPEAIPDLHLPGIQGVGMPCIIKKYYNKLAQNADKLRKRLHESTEDMMSGRPEAECSPSRSSSSHDCNVCGRGFTQSSSVKRHMVVHTGEKNSECDICKKKFTCKRNVKQHMKIHIGEKKYECTICIDRFTKNSSLEKHMLFHSKLKKYECHICMKRFKRNDYLKKHKTIHENIFTAKAIYQCHICNKKYELESVFKWHVLSHNKDMENETPFEYVEIPPYVKKETDDSCFSETSDNIFDEMCDEREDCSCTIKSEGDIKTEEYCEEDI